MTNGIITQEVVYKSNKGTPVTDSLKVAQVFGKLHKNVMKSIRGLAQNLADRTWFYETTYQDAQGKTQPMFVMNRDGFSLLAMGLTGAKAMQFKVGFIEQFNQMETIVKEVAQRPAIPQTLSEALRLAANQAEQIEQQEKQIEAERPRVLFSQAVETAKQSVLIGELAKIICQNGVQIGEKDFSSGYVITIIYAHWVNATINPHKNRLNKGFLNCAKSQSTLATIPKSAPQPR